MGLRLMPQIHKHHQKQNQNEDQKKPNRTSATTTTTATATTVTATTRPRQPQPRQPRKRRRRQARLQKGRSRQPRHTTTAAKSEHITPDPSRFEDHADSYKLDEVESELLKIHKAEGTMTDEEGTLRNIKGLSAAMKGFPKHFQVQFRHKKRSLGAFTGKFSMQIWHKDGRQLEVPKRTMEATGRAPRHAKK